MIKVDYSADCVTLTTNDISILEKLGSMLKKKANDIWKEDCFLSCDFFNASVRVNTAVEELKKYADDMKETAQQKG